MTGPAGYSDAGLGGTVRYLGPTVGAAVALDFAWLTARYMDFFAVVHAANLCLAERAAIDDFLSVIADRPMMQRDARVIRDESFGEFTASLAVWGAARARVPTTGERSRHRPPHPSTRSSR